jgi:hypothetical protein
MRRNVMMKKHCTLALAAAAVLFSATAGATGLAKCDSGDRKNWKPKSDLVKQLEAQGWKVRNVKVDEGCYEVYALNDKGKRVEAYFHPKTLAPVPTKGH